MEPPPRRVRFPFSFPFPSLGLLLLLVTAPACQKLQNDEIRVRVNNVLSGIQAEGGKTGDKLNGAMLAWDGGERNRDGLDSTYNHFVHWSRKKDIDRPIADYEITDIEIQSDVEPLTAIVSVRIEGKPLQMKVTRGARIEWAD